MPVKMGTCARCAYFYPLNDSSGECRRHAPRPVGSLPGMDHLSPLMGIWPRIGKSEGCGEFVSFEAGLLA